MGRRIRCDFEVNTIGESDVGESVLSDNKLFEHFIFKTRSVSIRITEESNLSFAATHIQRSCENQKYQMKKPVQNLKTYVGHDHLLNVDLNSLSHIQGLALGTKHL